MLVVIVHHHDKLPIEMIVGVDEISLCQLAKRYVEISLMHPPQLFHLLSSLSFSKKKGRRYLFRYGDGYATIVDATWSKFEEGGDGDGEEDDGEG